MLVPASDNFLLLSVDVMVLFYCSMWFSMVLNGFSAVIDGFLLLSMVIDGFPWLLMVFCC